MFVEEYLKAQSLRISTAPFYDVVWDDASFDRFVRGASEANLTDSTSTRLGIAIQSNLHKPLSSYRARIYELWERAARDRESLNRTLHNC